MNYDELNSAILNEHNRIRRDPQCYIAYLEDHLKHIDGNTLYRGDEAPIALKEGAEAVKECIEHLRRQRPVRSLTYDKHMSRANQLHLEELAERKEVSHASQDGRNASERTEQHVEWSGYLREVFDVASKTAREVIISLIVDDGVSSRKHRASVFDKNMKYIGIFSGDHPTWGNITVVTYASEIREYGMPYGEWHKEEFKFKDMEALDDGEDDDLKEPEEHHGVKECKSRKMWEDYDRKCHQHYYTLDDEWTQVNEKEEY